jgi:hypothetical protein
LSQPADGKDLGDQWKFNEAAGNAGVHASILQHMKYFALSDSAQVAKKCNVNQIKERKVRTIRAIMEVRKNILEVTEEKRLRWFGHARKQTATENFRMGTRGNAKEGKTQREMDRWSMMNHGLTEEDTRDRDRWRNLVLGEGKPL